MVTYTAKKLLAEVQTDLGDGCTPPTDYLHSEYVALLTALVCSLPAADASVTLTPADGRLATELSASQIRRVLAGKRELLRGSGTLLHLLPHAPIYAPDADGIAVNVSVPCTVYYRRAPATGLDDPFPLEIRYLPLVRAYLRHRACLYTGDLMGADAFCTEYNRLLAEFRTENGVQA